MIKHSHRKTKEIKHEKQYLVLGLHIVDTSRMCSPIQRQHAYFLSTQFMTKSTTPFGRE